MQNDIKKISRKSIRLKGYDYTTENLYFITICTNKRKNLFGKIKRGKIVLNSHGMIASNEWLKTEEIRKNISLDYYIIMPNHIHGIISINNGHAQRVPTFEQFGKSEKNSISTIIRSYKSSVTRQIKESGKTLNKPVWQSRFYDRIIRNEKELNRIRMYIINNPMKWQYDRENINDIPLEKKKKFWKNFLS
jgi:putative transposase